MGDGGVGEATTDEAQNAALTFAEIVGDGGRGRGNAVADSVGSSSFFRTALSSLSEEIREVAQKLLFLSFVFCDLGQVVDASEFALVKPLLSLTSNAINQDCRHE